MKLALTGLLVVLSANCATAFVSQPLQSFLAPSIRTSSSRLFGYLDDLNKYIGTAEEEDEGDDSREATAMAQDKKDRFGVGDWSSYVEFQEFDGGDGQMGVAGDGKQGLEKEWSNSAEIGKSKLRSARNAWGSSSGYADKLREEGVETSRAQQLENWHNQQEVLQSKRAARFMTDEFDSVSTDESWRDLSKFGVERNQNFDFNTAFGPVQPGDRLEGAIDLQSRLNRNEAFEFPLKNSFMGFSDFRAAFCPDDGQWTVEPAEGSISGRQATDFIVKFRPSNIGVSEVYLVIDTEDDKWTWKCTGTGSM
ncbi:hypothetical protein MPSEU_000205600 [Mayamaea pseudoterrestris]|nr:hypothetical protein MPSEU_000205600 [Mayamaea pseudoterrestris]